MPYAKLDEVTLYYEVSGPPSGSPLVLIHGMSAQMIAWYPGFVAMLEEEGFRVIRFDNRDVGLSSIMQDENGDIPYTGDDMAADVAQLLTYLGIEKANIVGQSMGGIIAQLFAINHPDRLLSLVSIYSLTDPEKHLILNDDPEVSRVRNAPPPSTREERIARYIETERISGLDGFDEEWIEIFAAQVVDRGYHPEGVLRQQKATMSLPDRTAALGDIHVPTAVIHGRNDRLVSWEGGVDTARAIPGAELHVFSEMGHQVKPAYWADFVRIIRRTATRGLEA